MKPKKLMAVITTIQAPTASVRKLCRALRPLKATLLIVGDRKGPDTYPLSGTDLLSIESQLAQPLRLARLLPLNHYVRKNLGYLTAISRGAECIYETDDDNGPSANWRPRVQMVRARGISRPGWFNVFRHFSDQLIWPRGFPLREILPTVKVEPRRKPSFGQFDSPIQQGMVDRHPDVDAIWRLVFGDDLYFRKAESVALMPGVWSPFNSQTTWWFSAAYPLLYLPSFCTFRMTDIWRSFVAQRCLWAMGAVVTFHAAEVVQQRNVHNLLKDFQDEVPGYLNNEAICQALESAKLKAGPEAAGENLLRCYEVLVGEGIFPKKELRLVRAWLSDLGAIGEGLKL